MSRMKQGRPYIYVSSQYYCYLNKKAIENLKISPGNKICLVQIGLDWYIYKADESEKNEGSETRINGGTVKFGGGICRKRILESNPIALANKSARFYISPLPEMIEGKEMFYVITQIV